jgi:hypothetical protein
LPPSDAPAKPQKKPTRQEREAAALRANLHRRKDQARERADDRAREAEPPKQE